MRTSCGCRIAVFLAILNLLIPSVVRGQDSPDNGGNGGTRDFAGLRFGIGISLTVDLGQDDRVESASVVNGIVRVENENNAVARIMLESHYFFKPASKSFLQMVEAGNWGHGPFVALQPGTDEIIEAVALGWMVGFKRAGAPSNATNSWNIGIGLVVDPNVQVLGEGLEPNQPLPPGETQVRYKEESQVGILILTSFSF
jgi:hypothetical protein